MTDEERKCERERRRVYRASRSPEKKMEQLERERRRSRARYKENPEKFKQRVKARYERLRDTINEQRQRRNRTEEGRRRLREAAVKRKYGLRPEDFQMLWDRQQGRCALCEVALVVGGRSSKSAAVDHDHKTGAVRGILCGPCNTSLGRVERGWDARAFAKGLENYLKKDLTGGTKSTRLSL